MFWLFSLLLFILAPFLVYTLSWWLWYKYSNFCLLLNKLPGPVPLPVIGSAHELVGTNTCEKILKVAHEKWPQTYGEMFRVYVTASPGVMLLAPELIELIINDPNVLDKSKEYGFLHPWLGLGLLTSSGAKWKSRRRLLTPAFHFHIMEDFFETFNEQSSVLCRKIDDLCGADEKVEINVEKLTSLCTLDIICESAMGFKVDAQTKESEYVKAVHDIAILLTQRPLRIWNRIDAIYHRTPMGRKYLKCLRILRNFTDQVVKARREQFQSEMLESKPELDTDTGIKKRRPFLDLLLEASANGTVLSDEDISEEVNTFMFEGHDTTASAMNWFLYCMAANADCQERVHDELVSVFGDSDRPCTRQDLPELKYLECCFKESLRLYPSVPVFFRLASKSLQIGGYHLPENCKFIISVYALHHNPRLYPDPHTYNPDRFSPEQSKGRHPYAYIPFSAGPRNCIGQRFALTEEKVVLSSLLRRFKFELSPSAPKPSPSMELTLKSTAGIHLMVSRR